MFNEKNTVKRFVSISAAAVCMLSALTVAPITPVEADAAATKSAFQITEEMSIGWNLGNTLDATGDSTHTGLDTETAWGCPKATQELFNAIKAKGFNTVRVPTTWFQHLDGDDNIDPAWMARVKEVVDYGIKNDMYVILNVHHENWINRSDLLTAYDQINPRLMKIWTQINEEFKDYDQHLIFECMNEPRAVGATYEWWSASPVQESDVINKLEHNFVDLIRSSDSPYAKTRLLMLPGYCASHESVFIDAIDVPDDPYVAVSIHAYSPYNFTMNTGTGGQHDTFTSQFSTELEGILTNIRNTFIDNNVPVVIGEMGASNFGNTQARCEWATTYITTAKKYGIPCVLWDNNTTSNPKDPGECHGYINRSSYQWYDGSEQVVDAMMSVINDSTIQWGSEGHLPELTHQAISDGNTVLQGPVEIDAAKADTYENTTPGVDITWADLEGKEVAVKYTGATPSLCFSNSGYANWTELKPYVTDKENGIAYFLMSQLPDAWGTSTDSIAHIQTRTDSTSTIESITILDEPTGEIDIPEPTSKIVKIDLSEADRNSTLAVIVSGPSGTKLTGGLGYMLDEWTQQNWSGTLQDDGTLKVEFALSEIPESVQQAEFQIWGNFDKVTDVTYSFVDSEDPTDGPDPALKPGDANNDGTVNLNDAVAILQYAALPAKYPLANAANADVDGTDGVSGLDALVIQMVDAGLIKLSELPLPAGYALR
ncbi:MAG: cellulase family glycosylhydrolase [Ruminococcus sp.]|nr:cellulase family glycosylhydrolase [Ruminococcus sp.]